jgi:hypothetical protein
MRDRSNRRAKISRQVSIRSTMPVTILRQA